MLCPSLMYASSRSYFWPRHHASFPTCPTPHAQCPFIILHTILLSLHDACSAMTTLGRGHIPVLEGIECPSRQMKLTLAFKSALMKCQRVQYVLAEGISAGTTSEKVSLCSKTCACNWDQYTKSLHQWKLLFHGLRYGLVADTTE